MGWIGGSLENILTLRGMTLGDCSLNGRGEARAWMMIRDWGFSVGAVPLLRESGYDWIGCRWPPLARCGAPNYELAVGGNLGINAASATPRRAAVVLRLHVERQGLVLDVASCSNFGEWCAAALHAGDFPKAATHASCGFFTEFSAATEEGR